MYSGTAIFAQNVDTLMKQHGLSQTALAKKVGVSSQAVSKWCRGKNLPQMQVIDKLCEVFGCTRHQLLEVVQTSESMFKSKYEKRLIDQFDRLNVEGLIKVSEYIETLNDKYFEGQKDDRR